MSIIKHTNFVVKVIVLGVLATIALIFILPYNLIHRRPVVEVRQSRESHSATSTQGPISYAQAVARAAPAVVNIYTSKTIAPRSHHFFELPEFGQLYGGPSDKRRKHNDTSLESGVIVSPQGYVLTNNHVVQNSDGIKILLVDGRKATAELVGADAETDLAILKIDLPHLPSALLSGHDQLRVGDIVLAIGNPFGMSQVVTQGIVSATGRNRLGINVIANFIQTDAAIGSGNSGGALINTNGELVGINTAIFSNSGSSQGVGFAIPAMLAKNIMSQIVENGRVVRGWLGVEIQELSPALAESFNLDFTQGVLVAGVVREGPARNSGIEEGDILLALNGQAIKDANYALSMIVDLKPGEYAHIKGIHLGQQVEYKIKVGSRPTSRHGKNPPTLM
jgi:serine protease DegS